MEVETKNEVVKKENRNMVASLENGLYSSSDTFQLAYQMAKGLSQSTLVPQTFQNNPANCMIALEQSNRLGISPMAVMQNLYIVSGKPSFQVVSLSVLSMQVASMIWNYSLMKKKKMASHTLALVGQKKTAEK